MTKNIPVIHKHWFRSNDPNYGEIASYAPTPAEALKQFSREGEGYSYTRSEELPYEFTDRALAIAEALPGEWEASPQSDEHAQCNWELRRSDGLTLYLSGPSYDHRLQFRFGLSAPRHNGSYVMPYNENNDRVANPVIGCGKDKTPAQMAKDIERRLLADAERVNGYVLASIERSQSSEAAQMESWTAVHVALGKPAPDTKRGTSNGYFEGGSFEVHGGGSVTFKLYSVEADKAVRLASALRAIL